MYEITCYDSNGDSVSSLTQWDSNITLYIDDLDSDSLPVCHFCNKNNDTAYVVNSKKTNTGFSVEVPNILLKEPYTIIVYFYIYDNSSDSGRTMFMIRIPVIKRPEPDGYIYKDNIDYVDAYVINARMKELFSFITKNPNYTGAAELIDIRTSYDGTTYDSAGEAVRSLGEELESIKKEIMEYIDKKAVNGLSYENNMLALTSDGEQVGDAVEIKGGSGGSGGASTIVRLLNNNGTSTISAALGQDVKLSFTFSSTEEDIPTGDGTCRIMVNSVVKTTFGISQGVTEVNIKDYLSSGSNTVRVTCTDTYGNYRNLTYYISVVELFISSKFDDSVPYSEDILFKYTPNGAIEKTVHFYIDGSLSGTSVITASGKQTTKIIPFMSHGAHKLEVYMTASLDGQEMESNHLVYDIMCIESDETDAMIASAYAKKKIKQGEQVSIPYIVYDPQNLSCDITLTISTVSAGVRETYSATELTVDRAKQYWNTRRYPIGNVEFAISYGDIKKTHSVEVIENVIDVEAVTNDLDVYLSAVGRSNKESDPSVWENNSIDTTFNNFNWSSNGWLEDKNGDVALRLNGDAQAVINISPFDSDLKMYGKTIEIEFAIRDVNNRDAVVISCMNGDIGFQATADTAIFKSEQTSVDCFYGDEERIRLSFVVESRSEYRMLSIYLNGILSVVRQYPANDNFQQSNPVPITIGSKYCAVDIYTIRSYSTALSHTEVRDNYIADMQDIVEKQQVNEDNDIYDDYNNISYDKVKTKIPVMTIIGDLPQSKGDKKSVVIKYEDCFNPNFDFRDNCTIDVQGTSSQYYVVKNYKEKFKEPHQNDVNQMPISVFCLKADYAEATSTHNTGNANLIHTLYSDKTPAQIDDERCRTTVYGFPCVIFHQKTESADPVFVGKYNFNADKGAENLFGFTSQYDVECWEFLNNTSEPCNFKSAISEKWDDDFEARYPDGNIDISRFKQMHDWVVSTIDDQTKFKNEFEQHFNLHKCLIYYVYTFLMLMVDQRAKNMMMTYWEDTGKWEPWFYDNDTCLGINNEGQLVFDYYHEDTDKLNDANVYNGQDSILWNNFRVAYQDEIKETYQNLRNNGKITYDKLYDYFIAQESNKWPISIYNDDSEYKYISMLKSENDASNLSQVRGNGKEHFKYFVRNRLMYCDSKWFASDYANNYVSLRIYTPSTYEGVEPNANITVTPFSNMYAGVKYKANGTLQQQKVQKNTPYTFVAPTETFNDTETAIYGASELSSIGDLSPLYCGSINVSMATKLTELIIGSNETGYSNPNLNSLSVGTNKLLKKIDVQNCPNLTDSLGLSNCPNIEEVYAKGSGITSVELSDSGFLRVLQLPGTITNLTLKSQFYLQDLSLEGYDAVKTICIEDCPTIDTFEIVQNCDNLERLRLSGIDWSFDDVSYLQSLYSIGGIDENGYNSEFPYLIGTCHITSLTGAEMADINSHYPYLEITYTNLTADLYFMSEDGNTQYQKQTINNGGDGNYTGSTPTKSSTAQYSYSFAGWALKPNQTTVNTNALKNVAADRYVYAVFTATIRKYTVYFYNGSTLLQTVQNVNYGSNASYTGTTPVKTGVDKPEDYEFSGWSPSPTNIQGNTSCYAQFTYTGFIQDDWDVIAANVENGSYKSLYGVGGVKELTLTWSEDNTETVVMEIGDFDHDDLADGSGKAGISFIAQNLLTEGEPMNDADTNDGGWGETKMRIYCNTDIFNVIPTKLQSAIKEVNKISDGGYVDQTLKTTADKIWIPSCAEVGWANLPNAVNGQSTPYPIFTNNASRKRTKFGSTSYCNWWLRSAYVYSTFRFHGVDSSGDWDGYTGGNLYGVLPCFCIGQSHLLPDTWEDIFAAEADGTYKEKYSIGDQMEVELTWSDGTTEKMIYEIGDFDHDDLADGSGKAKITWIPRNLISKNKVMNSSQKTHNDVTAYNAGGWGLSDLRAYCNGDVYNAFPDNIKAMIKEVNKISDGGQVDPTLKTTVDKIWIPSVEEAGYGSISGNVAGQGTKYPIFTDHASRKRANFGTVSYRYWWLRSAGTSSSDSFRGVGSDGDWSGSSAGNTCGVAPCFCT